MPNPPVRKRSAVFHPLGESPSGGAFWSLFLNVLSGWYGPPYSPARGHRRRRRSLVRSSLPIRYTEMCYFSMDKLILVSIFPENPTRQFPSLGGPGSERKALALRLFLNTSGRQHKTSSADDDQGCGRSTCCWWSSSSSSSCPQL